jgi:hypothetical protein
MIVYFAFLCYMPTLTQRVPAPPILTSLPLQFTCLHPFQTFHTKQYPKGTPRR